MNDFNIALKAYLGLAEKDTVKIVDFFFDESISKGNYFIKKEQLCQRLSFVKSGYLRIYTIVDSKEITQWIVSPNNFVTELSSLMFNLPSRFYIQAITDCEVLSISKLEFNNLNNHINNWHQIEKTFIAKCFTVLENRVLSHLSMSAEERYAFYYSQNKELFNIVPLQYIASLLGMSPETLSRIRKRI